MKTLFEPKTLFHKTDPPTSYDAAVKMVETGALSRQEKEVLSAIIDCRRFARRDSFTAKELTQSFYFETTEHAYHKIQRRLSGLNRKGWIERTGSKRGGCCVWRLKENENANDITKSEN